MSATVPLVQLDEVGGVESPVAGARRAGGDAGGGRTHRREWMRAGEAGSGCVRARRRRGILRRCGRASGGGLGQGAGWGSTAALGDRLRAWGTTAKRLSPGTRTPGVLRNRRR
jgi:hypothetical protein